MAGLSLSLLLVVGLVAWQSLDEDRYVAPVPEGESVTASPAAAAVALDGLRDAVGEGDVDAAAALSPPDDARSRARLRALAVNAGAIGLTDLTFGYVTELGGVDRDGTWAAAVDASWAFEGFDEAPARAEVRVVFRAVDGEVFVVRVGGGSRRTPVWMSGPVQVRRTSSTLVVARAGERAAGRVAEVTRAAVPVVRRVLTRSEPRIVVEVPASTAALHRALDADAGTYTSIAAVTTTVDGSLAPDAPVHVFVNPEVFGDLQPRGAQVVMSHEAVHVVTDAATSSTLPLWLLEGFADYVALRDVPLDLSVTAAQVIRQVRRDGPPARLPTAEEFDTRTPDLGASYEAAWLACRLLARREDEGTLVRFYRAVDSGVPVGRALGRHYDLSLPQFTRAWRGLLRDVAA